MHFNVRTNTAILILLSCAYFFLFLPPNLTGAKDSNMLSIFQIDEYAQYPHVMKMTSLGTSLLGTLHNFVGYGHYYYGYPFFLTSATAILPLRFAFKFFGDSADPTMAYMSVLRQLSSLFMVMAINILVYMWTGFKSLWKSVFLFLFLASIPAVFDNNMWWHPDSLVTLFVVLTIFSLHKDNLEYGIWFYMASMFCGLATGTKLVGFWFFLAIAIYLALGLKRIGLKPLLRHAVFFFVIMFLAIVVSNPLLLIPRTAKSIIDIQISQVKVIGLGWGVQMTKDPLAWYTGTLRHGFGFWWVYIIVLGACSWGIRFDNDKRLLNIITLAWFVPFSLYLLFFVALKSARYFLPALLPMMSCIGNQAMWNISCRGPKQIMTFVFTSILLLLLGLQLVFNVQADINSYLHVLHREQESLSLEFYHQLDKTYFQKVPQGVRLTVFRDPYVYVPPLKNVDVRMKWGSADYRDIGRLKPDLILLQRDYVTTYSNPSIVNVSLKPEQAEESLIFYRDAKNNTIKGYHRILETPFGFSFERNK